MEDINMSLLWKSSSDGDHVEKQLAINWEDSDIYPLETICMCCTDLLGADKM